MTPLSPDLLFASANASVHFALHCLEPAPGGLRARSSFVDPDGQAMLWHDFGPLEGPGWAANAVGGAHLLYRWGEYLGNTEIQEKSLCIVDHILDDGFVRDGGFIYPYWHTVEGRFCLNYTHNNDWLCPGSVAKIGVQMLELAADLTTQSFDRLRAKPPNDLATQQPDRLTARAQRLSASAHALSAWLADHVLLLDSGWVPRRITPDGKAYPLSPHGTPDPIYECSADGLFLLQLWALTGRENLARTLGDAFVDAGGLWGSINHDTFDRHENVAYACAFRILRRVAPLLDRPRWRRFACEVALPAMARFRMAENRHGVWTEGLFWMEESWDTAYLWENAEVAQAHLEAWIECGAETNRDMALGVLSAIARHHYGSLGFLSEGVDWNNHVGRQHHIRGQYYGAIRYTEPLLNNLHLVEATLTYLNHIGYTPPNLDFEASIQAVCALPGADCRTHFTTKGRTMTKLNEPRFRPLPLGSIRPTGWLERQLRIQADGISGHLDEFWPDVRDSQWFGGDSEGWERAPYWLDGLIPLAFTLDDETLQRKVMRYMDYILTHQEEDGWLGPRTMRAAANRPDEARYDIWAQFLALKVLVQYHETSGDPRAVEAVEKNLRLIDRHIDRAPLFNWGQFRWFEALIAIYWLYEKKQEDWLLDLAHKLRAQGFDWGAFFAGLPGSHWPCAAPTPKGRWNYMSHVVNNAMAVKGSALWWRLSGDARDRAAAYDMIAQLDRHHGQVTGMFSGDECLAGRQPTHGTELCAVVEYAFGLETLLGLFGDPFFGDRLEKVVFNALPATFSPDMWAHQYDQQVNQVQCSVQEDWQWIWNTNGPESNTFGVEPNYGCCTANLSQGWPKFAAHLWMKTTGQEGLAAVAYAPSRVQVEIDGVTVAAALDTEYPFRDTLTFTVDAERPVRFPLYLRIPAWARRASIQLEGETIPAQAGTFACLDRLWRGTTQFTLTLPMRPRLWRGYNDAVAVERGPLVYSLKIGEEWRRIHADAPYRELPHADWEVYPTTPWNYALDIDEATLDSDLAFSEHPLGDMPFSPDGAPVSATVQGRRLPQWTMENGTAADAPVGPVESGEPLETLTLIPYGCTNLRITEFPVLAK